MDNFANLLFGAMLGPANRQTVVGRDTVGRYTIDTCYTVDCGWETAVWKDNYDMIIVGRYATEKLAREGHSDWCAVCAMNPTTAWSVQTDQYEYFDPMNTILADMEEKE